MAEALPGLIAALRFDKVMRWNSSQVRAQFAGCWPCLGDSVVHFQYAGLTAGRKTRGLRFASEPKEFTVASPAAYQPILAAQQILLDPPERRATIAAQVHGLVEGRRWISWTTACSTRMTALVEPPTALLGSFDAAHLKLPAEVLISVMKKHQRYLPGLRARRRAAALISWPYATATTNPWTWLPTATNRVIRARFADATLFVAKNINTSWKTACHVWAL